MKLAIVPILILFFTSCDAMLSLSYYARNKTRHDILIKVESYPVDGEAFGKTVDTVLTLKPGKYLYLGTMRGIGFPWETRSIFREYPACNNFSILSGDSLINADTSVHRWKFRNGSSVYKVLEKDLH